MMKNLIIIPAILFSILFSGCEDLLNSVSDDDLSREEVVEGLKTALEVGTDTATNVLSLTDGYYKDELVKILLPDEADVIINNLSLVPYGEELVDELILAVNRSAESAANEAGPIFSDAITQMSIKDAWTILNGTNPVTDSTTKSAAFDSTAATAYFRSMTYNSLSLLYSEKINAVLDKQAPGMNISANSLWNDIITPWNSTAPFLGFKTVNANLGEHCTEKALDGLFLKVGQEERKIRRDPWNYALDILERVFGNLFEEN